MSWFWLDLISAIPFSFFYQNDPTNTNRSSQDFVLRFIGLTKLFRIFRFIRNREAYIKMLSCNIKTKPKFDRIFGTIIMTLVIFHIISCLWYIVASIFFLTKFPIKKSLQ